MKPTIKDVAKLANVSIATVSRVINNSPLVTEETKRLVHRAIRELGYEPNALARGLVNRKTNTIGVLIPDVSNFFFSEVFKGMEDAAHQFGINVIICNTDMSKDRMLKYIKFLKEKQVDGVIFTSEPVTEEYRASFISLGVPVVLISTSDEEGTFSSVKVDDYQAAYDGVSYLISKGHTQIGMISGSFDDPIAGLPRYEGYKQAIADHGIPFSQDLVVTGNYRYEGGLESMKKLILLNPTMTAVFAASDEMAIGAMAAIQHLNKRVPEDISVLGFDNVKIAQMSFPGLTTVAQPLHQLGRRGVELLVESIDDPNKLPQQIFLPHTIVERKTVSFI
ncbi:LacI family transcriptional regulator [Microaerobacter geothermalis]|uniref:LacI family DNA-binding transcriptional regulator n=1 Tax=Microaerobacter geothermalis TaxID=674972 RepID=UPI001F2F453A|nr:LacI family DNA-binding transcriptional regulator [Microaerobacter geothermalis]MCF6092790.1 LacI family transcriptional regulator [Microaerobacter geothermalis]